MRLCWSSRVKNWSCARGFDIAAATRLGGSLVIASHHGSHDVPENHSGLKNSAWSPSPGGTNATDAPCLAHAGEGLRFAAPASAEKLVLHQLAAAASTEVSNSR